MRCPKCDADFVFLSRHVDSDQAEVRSAALDAVESCYMGLDMDSARIHRLLGAVNDKTKTLIDEVLAVPVSRTPFHQLFYECSVRVAQQNS